MIRPLLLSLLFYASFSKWSLWPLIFVFFYLLSQDKSFKAWILTGIFSCFFSLFWVRISVHDYGGVPLPLALLLVFLLASFVAVMQFGITYILWRFFKFSLIALPFLWTFSEIFRSLFPYGGFPWLIVGELSVDIPIFYKVLSLGGVYLGTFAIISLALVLRKPLIGGLILALALAGLYLWTPPFKKPPPVKVSLVQTNVPEEDKLNTEAFYRHLPRLWALLEETLKENPDLIVFPESAFPFRFPYLMEEGQRLLEASKKVPIIVGLVDVDFSSERVEPKNSVFLLKGGKVQDRYDKVKLLPFGEFVPFPFGFAKDIFGAIAGIDFVKGKGPKCFDLGLYRISTPICFEVSHFFFIRSMGKCSDMVVVLTNDGWFRDSDGTFQHMRQARVRAVENRLYLLWVNNTGPTAVISPEGKILKSLPYGVSGILTFDFRKLRTSSTIASTSLEASTLR